MTATILTKDGRIDLPAEIQKKWGLKTGDRLALRLRPDGVVEMEPAPDGLMSLFGSIRSPVQGVSLEDMDEAIRAGGHR